MLEPGIPRHGFTLDFSENPVGTVTSGTFSPILKKGIGMGYLRTPLASLGQRISVDVRGSDKSAIEVATPFYDTTKYGFKRKMTQ